MPLTKYLLAPLAGFALGLGSANAAIVYFPNEDIPIPVDFAGVSVDLDTGASSTSLNGLPDGDANFFFGGAMLSNDADFTATTPTWQPVRVAAGDNTAPAASLSAGVDTVGPTNNYATGFGSSGDLTPHFPDFVPGERGYIGFSLIPNSGGGEVFGWVEVTLQNDGATPGTIHAWAFEDTGAQILVGAIPEPGSTALALAGLSLLALRRRRR